MRTPDTVDVALVAGEAGAKKERQRVLRLIEHGKALVRTSRKTEAEKARTVRVLDSIVKKIRGEP